MRGTAPAVRPGRHAPALNRASHSSLPEAPEHPRRAGDSFSLFSSLTHFRRGYPEQFSQILDGSEFGAAHFIVNTMLRGKESRLSHGGGIGYGDPRRNTTQPVSDGKRRRRGPESGPLDLGRRTASH